MLKGLEKRRAEVNKSREPPLRRDIVHNFKVYIKNEGVFDILTTVPMFIYMLVLGYDLSEDVVEGLRDDKIFITCMALRVLRLVHMFEIANQLRLFVKFLEENFHSNSLMLKNLLSWTLALSKLVLSMHYLTCGWILIHQFDKSQKAEFFSNDSHIGVVYLDSVYFMVTMISTVGYGQFSAFDEKQTAYGF